MDVGEGDEVGSAATSATWRTTDVGKDDKSLFKEGTTQLFLGGGSGGDVDITVAAGIAATRPPLLPPHIGDDVTNILELAAV